MVRASTLCLSMLVAVMFADAAELPARVDEAVFFKGTLAKPQDNDKITKTIGRSGVLLVRSAERWDAIQKLCPDLTSDRPVPKVDFTKQMMVLAFDTDRRGDDSWRLSPAKGGQAAGKSGPRVLLNMQWDDRPEEQREMRYAMFALVLVPAGDAAEVGLTSQTLAPDSRPLTEFSATIGGKDGGDVVDGLQAKIAAKAKTIKAGEDLLVDFELHLASMPDAKPLKTAFGPEKVHVWDGKYSNGYRNHSFYVTTPDGKTATLRPSAAGEWEKNAPHPVAITSKTPYHLPNWVEGDTRKSLKALGLDTSAPGTYTVTGVYQQTAEEAGAGNRQTPMWGGSIASNTITVTVEK